LEETEGVGIKDFTSETAVEAFSIAGLHGWLIGVALGVKLVEINSV
jgi:hypothetical protein